MVAGVTPSSLGAFPRHAGCDPCDAAAAHESPEALRDSWSDKAMETKKEYALRSLGATTKKNISYLASNVEHVVVRSHRPLRKRGHLTSAVLIGVRGSIVITDERGNTVEVNAPYIVDRWVADDQAVVQMDVTSLGESELLVVGCQVRDSVFALLPRAEQISLRTLAVAQAAADQQRPNNDAIDVRQPLLAATKGGSDAAS